MFGLRSLEVLLFQYRTRHHCLVKKSFQTWPPRRLLERKEEHVDIELCLLPSHFAHMLILTIDQYARKNQNGRQWRNLRSVFKLTSQHWSVQFKEPRDIISPEPKIQQSKNLNHQRDPFSALTNSLKMTGVWVCFDNIAIVRKCRRQTYDSLSHWIHPIPRRRGASIYWGANPLICSIVRTMWFVFQSIIKFLACRKELKGKKIKKESSQWNLKIKTGLQE